MLERLPEKGIALCIFYFFLSGQGTGNSLQTVKDYRAVYENADGFFMAPRFVNEENIADQERCQALTCWHK
jgi:hypothetical protein